MKKTMMMIAIAALAAGNAFAGEGACCKKGSKDKAWSHDGGGKQAWAPRDERGGERPGGPMSPEMMEQMRAEHRAIRELGEAARAETDEAKKAELVAQLRAKLNETADLVQANQERRLAQAEERLAGLKAKIEDSKTNRDTMIEEQIQRILSGERPPRPAGFDRFPYAKGGMHEGDKDGKGQGPCGKMPPPPEDEMRDDMNAPPPEE